MLSNKNIFTILVGSLFLISCGSLRVNENELKEIQKNETYENAIKIETVPTASEVNSAKESQVTKEKASSTTATNQKSKGKKSSQVNGNNKKPRLKSSKTSVATKEPKIVTGQTKSTSAETSSVKSPSEPSKNASTNTHPLSDPNSINLNLPHLPEMEGASGFNGRRPLSDPYRVGEKMVFAVNYFNMTAGTMSLETLPAKIVNGKLSYHFKIHIKSADSFAWVYTVDDWAETFVDYQTMVPYNYVINIKQKNEVGENRCLFDWETLNAKLWERKITDKGKNERVFDWKLEPFSQNVLSLPVYLRAFQLAPQKKFSVPFGHRGENLILAADVSNREILETDFGPIKTIVIKPTFKLDGAFKPVGEIKLWYTDDEQKLLVRIESEIKIGTIVAEIKSIERGGSVVSPQ